MSFLTAGIADGVAVSEWDLTEAHGLALESRGLSVEEATARLGWRACGGPGDDLWIAMPIVDGDERLGTKRRTISGEKRFSQDKGTPQILYNVDALRDPELGGFPMVIVEGEMDCLAALQSGYLKTVSVPGGAPAQDAGGDGPQWNYLAHAEALLKNQGLIILAVDNDAPGKVLELGLAKRLGRGRCMTVSYPEGCKDLNDVLRQGGEVSVRAVLATATYYPVPGLMRLHEMTERPFRPALDTCIPGLEPHMRIRKGDLVVVTGPPGHGKTAFVNNVCLNMGWHHGTTTAMASFEQPVVPDLRRVYRTYRSEQLEKFMGDEDKRIADSWIDQRFVFLQGAEGEAMTLGWLLERFAVAVQRYKVELCVIDPWNEVEMDKPDSWTVEQWVSQSLREIKKFARAMDVTVVIVAHPAKLRRDKFGKIPCPGLYDIADSAAWNNRADLAVVVWRPDQNANDLSEISVVKSRDHYSLGVPGIVTLQWQPGTSKFVRPGDA
jgi:twinkle protein